MFYKYLKDNDLIKENDEIEMPSENRWVKIQNNKNYQYIDKSLVYGYCSFWIGKSFKFFNSSLMGVGKRIRRKRFSLWI